MTSARTNIYRHTTCSELVSGRHIFPASMGLSFNNRWYHRQYFPPSTVSVCVCVCWFYWHNKNQRKIFSPRDKQLWTYIIGKALLDKHRVKSPLLTAECDNREWATQADLKTFNLPQPLDMIITVVSRMKKRRCGPLSTFSFYLHVIECGPRRRVGGKKKKKETHFLHSASIQTLLMC